MRPILFSIATVFLLILTYTNGKTHNLESPPPPTCTLELTVTNTTCYIANGAIDATVTGGTGNYVYLWSNGATTKVVSNLEQGTYFLSVTDGSGCSETAHTIVSFEEEPIIEWEVKPDSFKYAEAIIQTTDKGYVIAGRKFDSLTFVSDYLIEKLDVNGSLVWTKSFGGSSYDDANSIQQTFDGGFIVAGHSGSNDGDVTGNHGNYDCWIIKLDNSGNLVWQKTYGGSDHEYSPNIQQTIDGGYILTGSTSSTDGDLTGIPNNLTGFIFKLDHLGNILWKKFIQRGAIRQTTDGGYIIGNGNGNGYNIIKFGNSGNLIWQKTYGGTGWDSPNEIQETMDGRFVVTGFSYSDDGDLAGTHPGIKCWTILLDMNGNLVWQHSTGPNMPLYGTDVKQTKDGSFLLTAYSDNYEYTAFKLDDSGSLDWMKAISRNGYSSLTALVQSDDGGFAATGSYGVVFKMNSPDVITSSASTTDISCDNSTDGSIDLMTLGGITPYTFHWSNGASQEDLTGLIAGNYTVTITDSTGCSLINGPFSVANAPDNIGINIDVIQMECTGSINGSILITPTGGTPPYSYAWSNGSTQQDITGALSGTYQLTISDVYHCSFVSDPIHIPNVSNTMSPTLDAVQDELCPNYPSGMISVSVIGGTAPYSYQWSNGETTEDLTGLSQGNYQLTIVDTIGCITNLGPVTVSSSVLTSTVSKTTLTCISSSDGSINLTVSDGVPPYTYLWSNGSTNTVLSNLPAGNYTATIIDNGGCQITSNTVIVPSSPPTLIQWEQSYGGSSLDYASAIQQTQDGGYIVAGTTNSLDGDVTCHSSQLDYWIIKLDAIGNLEWQQCYNGGLNDEARSIQQTSDGGYIVTGKRVEYTFFPGDSDGHTIKLDAFGNIVWQHTLSGDYNGGAHKVVETASGGFLVAGYYAQSQLGNYYDYYDLFTLYRLNSAGVQVWGTSIGGSNNEQATAVAELNSGDIIAAGWTESNDGDVSGNHGGIDIWLVKIIGPGGPGWKKCLGGSGYDSATDILATPDGGFIVIGETSSHNGDVSYNYGGRDCWVVKLNNLGAIEWEKTYGGSGNEGATGIRATPDGEYLISAYSNSINGDVTMNQGGLDYWVFKIDATGNLIWQKTFGGSSFDVASAIDFTNDGGLVLAGTSASTNGDVSANKGYEDFWVVKLGYPEIITTQIDTVIQESCPNTSDGVIQVTATGGIAPYSFDWSNGESTEDISGLTSGSYDLTITDLNGCFSIVGPIVVGTIPNTLVLQVDSIQYTSCPVAQDGSIDITISGGSPPFTYLWSNGATTEDIFGLPSGSYSLLITDSNGCVTVEDPIGIGALQSSIAIQVDSIFHESCSMAADGSIDLTAVGGLPPFTFLWSDGSTDEDPKGLSAGSYFLTVTDSNGCTQEFGPLDIIQASPSMLVTYSSMNISCNGLNDGSIDLTLSGGLPPYTYIWNNGDTTEDVFGLPFGNYTCTIIDAIGCSVLSQTIQLTEPTAIYVSGTVTDETLPAENDGSIVLTTSGGTGPYTFVWDNGAMTQNLSGLAPGDYCVSATDATGCFLDTCYTVLPGMSAVVDLEGTNQFSLFPNPASSLVTLEVDLETNDLFTVQVMGSLGQILLEYSDIRTKQVSLELNDFSSGIYFVKLTIGEQQLVKKLVVAK